MIKIPSAGWGRPVEHQPYIVCGSCCMRQLTFELLGLKAPPGEFDLHEDAFGKLRDSHKVGLGLEDLGNGDDLNPVSHQSIMEGVLFTYKGPEQVADISRQASEPVECLDNLFVIEQRLQRVSICIVSDGREEGPTSTAYSQSPRHLRSSRL